MNKILFGIVGVGWRSEFFMRIARALPAQFEVAGVVSRNSERREAFARTWGRPVVATTEEMVGAVGPSFVVTAVSWEDNPVAVKDLVARGIPVLSETPPATGVEELTDLYRFVQSEGGRVQVAEQYHLQPHHAARIHVASAGLLGRVSQAEFSVAHGYHGISLIRRCLGIGFEPVTIAAHPFASPVVKGPDRSGPPAEETITQASRSHVWMDFGDRLGILDFSPEQYFSWTWGRRVLVRGDRGELVDDEVSYLKRFDSPVRLRLNRCQAGLEGNLEGNGLQSIDLGENKIYENPVGSVALSDEEIAVATCLLRMAGYVDTGRGFYDLSEGCHDRYLDILCQESLDTGRPVKTTSQVWQ